MALNVQNLKVPTSEQARINGSKGGKASALSKKNKKTMKEQLTLLLSLDLKNEKIKKQLASLGLDDNELNNKMALQVALFQKALTGDTKAYEIIRDTVGEVVTQEHNVSFADNIEEAWKSRNEK